MTAPNFVLISELQMNRRRDFYVADSSLLLPLGSNPLVDGEFLELDGNYKLARGTGAGIQAVYPVHTERGRYDTQAIGKVNVIMLDEFEAETSVVTTTSIAVGDSLKVGDVTNWLGSGLTKRGLLRATSGVGASGEVIVGYCTKLFAGQNKIRFVRTRPMKLV